MIRIEGYYSDGLTSRTEGAILRVDASGRVSVSPRDPMADPFISHVPGDAFEVSSRLGSAPRVITLPTGATFTTDEHDLVDDLLIHVGRGRWQRLLPLLENSLPLAAVATVVAGVMVWITITMGVPALAQSIAYNLPADVERNIGVGTLELLDAHYFEPSGLEDGVRDRVEGVFRPALERFSVLDPRVVFRNGGEAMGANAFALPSGVIVFTDDLVRIAEDDEQLLAVLYHEIGHLEHRHILRRSLQGSILTVLAVFITGDVSGVNEVVSAIPALVIDASYSRDFEREADDFALKEMSNSGANIESFGEILRLIEASHKAWANEKGHKPGMIMDFLQTHPGTPERIEAIRKFAEG